MAAVSHNTSFNSYLLGCGRIKPQTNIRKPGNAQFQISPQTAGSGRAAARHRTAQVFVFTHGLGSAHLGVRATCFSLRCSESGLSAAGSFGRACMCHQAPGCAAGDQERLQLCLLPPAWPGSQQRAAQKPGHG